MFRSVSAGHSNRAFSREPKHERTRPSIASGRLSSGGTSQIGSTYGYLNPGLGQEESEDDDKNHQALEWLSTCSPSSDYNKAGSICQDGTGDWFLNSSQFNSWLRSDGAFLWLHGTAGCGKTVLSSTIINAAKAHCRLSQRGALFSFFFFNFNDTSRQQIGNLLRTLIKDLCPSNGVFPAPVLALCDKYKTIPPPTTVLLNTFLTACDHSADKYIVIDALDECGVRLNKTGLFKIREELMDIIRQISSAGSNLRVLVTSRDCDSTDQINACLQKVVKDPNLQSFEVVLDGSKIDKDIEKLIDARFCVGSSIWQGLEASFIREVKSSLLSKGKGMFRLVACQLDYLESCISQDLTVSDLRLLLNSLSSNLDDMYSRILERMPRKDRDLVILKYMACSLRPLSLRELGELTLLSNDCTKFSLDNMPAIGPARYMARIFSSLITITGEMGREDAEVQLSHYTVMGFLSNPSSKSYIETSEANLSLATLCLSYLQFCVQSAPDNQTSASDYFAQRQLFEYSANSWYTHASKAYREIRPVQRTARRSSSSSIWSKLPLGNPTKYQEDKLRSLPPSPTRIQKPDAPQSFSDALLVWIQSARAALQLRSTAVSIDLHQKELAKLACSGYEHIITWILKNHPLSDLNFSHYHVLKAALSGRVDNVLQIILGTSRTSSQASSWFGGIAAQASAQSIVTSLVNNNIDLNARNRDGETPLHWAAKGGRKTAVKTILNHTQVDIAARNNSDVTPLVLAAKHGHDKIVWLLLAADADHSRSSQSSALEEASRHGHYACAKLLLGLGIGIDHPGNYGNTPLQSACLNGHERLAALLIEQGADVNAPAGSDGTALQAAGRAAHRDIIRLLIKSNARINAQQGHSSSPLAEAAKSGDLYLAEILLDNGADVNYQGGEYHTPLQAAGYKGNREMVTLLLKRGAEIDIQGGYYGTALQAACYNGNGEVIGLLIDRGAKVNAQCGKYDTALQAACYRGHKGVVQLLLDCGAKVNAQGGIYGTPLQAACYSGNQDIVEILLKSGAMVNVQRGQFNTALQAARMSDNQGIVNLLLDSGAMTNRVDKSPSDSGKQHRLIARSSLPRLAAKGATRERKGSLVFNR